MEPTQQLTPNQKFYSVFGKLPIIGMIHLAGNDPVKKALEEVAIYEAEGVDAIIVENYHGSARDVAYTLNALKKTDFKIIRGVNVLPNDYGKAFYFAEQYGCKFIQLDHVAGQYNHGTLNVAEYKLVKSLSKAVVLGGIWPKYYTPLPGSNLEDDIKTGMERAEAIVVTGEATGFETPIEKVKEFRRVLQGHVEIIGAGLNIENAPEQLMIGDGAIVGSYFKHKNETHNDIDLIKVSDFMSIVKEIRAKRYSLP